MGCLIQMFFYVLSRFLWYIIINPIITILFFLKDIGLIWSISFYIITDFFFLNTFIQDYRILITVLLLLPVIIKIIKKISLIITRLSIWKESRRLKKNRKLKETINEETPYKVKGGDNFYGEK